MKKNIMLIITFTILLVGCTNENYLTEKEMYDEIYYGINVIYSQTDNLFLGINNANSIEEALYSAQSSLDEVNIEAEKFKELIIDPKYQNLFHSFTLLYDSVISLYDEVIIILNKSEQIPELKELLMILKLEINEIFYNYQEVYTELATLEVNNTDFDYKLETWKNNINYIINQLNNEISEINIPEIK